MPKAKRPTPAYCIGKTFTRLLAFRHVKCLRE